MFIIRYGIIWSIAIPLSLFLHKKMDDRIRTFNMILLILLGPLYSFIMIIFYILYLIEKEDPDIQHRNEIEGRRRRGDRRIDI